MITYKKDLKTILAISEEYKQKGDYIGAISVLLNDKVYSKKDWFLYYKLGQLYLEIEDYDRAEFYFLKYAQLNNANAKCMGFNGLAVSCMRTGRDDLALRIFDIQWDIKPKKDFPYNEELFSLYSSFESEEKEQLFTGVAKLDVNSEKYYNASMLYKKGKYLEAIKLLKKIDVNAKKYDNSVYLTAFCYLKLKKDNTALKYFKKYFEIAKKISPEKYFNFIDFLNKNNPVLFKKYVEKLYSEKYSLPEELFSIAQYVAFALYDFEKSIEYIDLFLKTQRFDHDALFLKGMCLFNLEKKEEGLRYVKKAYLLTHSVKYKNFLMRSKMVTNYDKEQLSKFYDDFFGYHISFVKCMSDFISNPKKHSLNDEDIIELIDVGIEFNKQQYWNVLVEVLALYDKKNKVNFLLDLLMLRFVSVEVKQRVLEILALNNFSGDISVYFDDYLSRLDFYPSNVFLCQDVKEAYCFAVSSFPVLSELDFYNKAIEIDNSIFKKRDYYDMSFNKRELAGAIVVICAPDFKLTSKLYKYLKVTKKRVLEIVNIIKPSD